mmetsp:Transcript_6186/g.12774  ORF Transcript_6186/g.12774 Transcript_6186/m.12774 type:complete len:369 (+) Transcript_6186:165-1271(+)
MAKTKTTMRISLFLLFCFGMTDAWIPLSSSVVGSKGGIPTCLKNEIRHTGRFLQTYTIEEAVADTNVQTEQTILLDAIEGGNSTAVETIHYTMLNATIHDSSTESSSSQSAASNQSFTPEQKFTNLVVLSLAFGYAAYTIFGIDSGMTRGWSASEIAMRIPLDNWGAYESYLANKPILTKSLINVIIYLLGDWLSQTAFTKTNNLLEFDLQRTLRNGFIGLCFGPLVHEYYEFSDRILPPENGLVTRMEKILMDQTLYLTIKCSLYIGAVGLLAGEDRKSVGQTIQDKIGGIVVTAWKFWPIVHCVTYSVIPAQHRVLWVTSVDLVWNAILSSAAQKGEESEEATTTAAVDTTNGQTNTTNTVAWVAT